MHAAPNKACQIPAHRLRTGILDIVCERFWNIADIAGAIVERPGIGGRVEHRHPGFAFDHRRPDADGFRAARPARDR